MQDISIILTDLPFGKWRKPLSLLSNAYICDNITLPNERCALIIPLSCDGQRKYIMNKHSCHSKMFVSKDISSINALDDKYLFIKLMIEHNLSSYIPNTYIGDTDVVPFPAILKGSKSSGGRDCHIINNVSELTYYRTDQAHNYILQQYIVASHEYCGNFAVIDGVVVSELYYEEPVRSKYHICNGNKKHYRVVASKPSWRELFARIFHLLNYTGFACADFRLDADAIPKVFEINPRLGYTLVKNHVALDHMIQIVHDSLLSSRGTTKTGSD